MPHIQKCIPTHNRIQTKMRIALFLILNLYSFSKLQAFERVIDIVLVRTANTNGTDASTATAEGFKHQVDRANIIWAQTGIKFTFNPVSGFPPIVSDTILHHDFFLASGQSLNQPKDKEPQVNGTTHAQAKNNYVRAHYPSKLVVFSGLGDMLQFSDALGRWEIVPRTFAYGTQPDLFVQWFNSDASENVFAHEVGHFLHLGHTHGWLPKNKIEFQKLVADGIKNGYTPANVSSMFDGDGGSVTDTPADPGPELWAAMSGDACGPSDTISVPVSVNGSAFFVAFTTDRRNIMSYFKDCNLAGEHRVSSQQAQRAREGIDFGNRLYLINQNPGHLIPQWSPEIKAVSWAPGRLDLFAAGNDIKTIHKAFDSSAGWYPQIQYGNELWENLGGKIVGKPAAVAWGPNRLDVFVRGVDNAIYHKAWDGTKWLPGIQDWEFLGGNIAGSPVAVSWAQGRLDIFGRSFDGHLYHKWWSNQSGWGPSKTAWEDLGGKLSSDPSVTSWSANRLDIVARDAQGSVIHKAFSGNAWYPSLTDWNSLGGNIIDQPSMVSWGVNRLDIVARGTDNKVYHKAWGAQGWYPSQTGWNSLGGAITSRPTMVSWGSGRLDIVAQGSDSRLYHKAYQEGSGWYPDITGWSLLGAWMMKGTAAEIISWKPGRLDLFIRNSNFMIQHKAWDGNTWYPSSTNWEDLGKYVE